MTPKVQIAKKENRQNLPKLKLFEAELKFCSKEWYEL